MGTKESMREIKIINTLNSDINRSNKYINSKDRYQNAYKRNGIRANAHTVKFLQDTNKIENKNSKLSSRKHIMTKEQRNLLKNILKENVKENKKTIAKNLIGVFLENNKKSSKKTKPDLFNINSPILINKNINNTPKASLFFKNNNPKKNQSTSATKHIKVKRYSTVLSIRPSYFKKQKEDSLKKVRPKERKTTHKSINEKGKKKINIEFVNNEES